MPSKKTSAPAKKWQGKRKGLRKRTGFKGSTKAEKAERSRRMVEANRLDRVEMRQAILEDHLREMILVLSAAGGKEKALVRFRALYSSDAGEE